MLPGVIFYLSTFYKRNELASRIGLFYAAASIAGAFSGLIAFGVFHIEHSKYHPWQFLFWIEGGATVCFAVFALFWLPRSSSTWVMLNDREKAIARTRILLDSSVAVDERLNIRDAFRPFKRPLYWVWALINLSFGVPLASVNNFLPQIVASLGYSTIRTNLLTVAPNVVGTVALLLLTFSSDYWRERSFHICIPLATALVGFVILGSIDVLARRHVAYFACFLLTMGAFAPSVLGQALSFTPLAVFNFLCSRDMVCKQHASGVASSCCSRSHGFAASVARLIHGDLSCAMTVAIANSSGLISTNVFRAQDAPAYIPGMLTHSLIHPFTHLYSLPGNSSPCNFRQVSTDCRERI